jgi:adenine deaminase
MPSSTKLTQALVNTAMGRLPADLVIRNGQWVSVQSGEIIPDTDIWRRVCWMDTCTSNRVWSR